MPLPNLNPETQCNAKCKRTGKRCLRLRAWGCKTCMVHGARRPDSILRGANHPQYRHGRETLVARAERHEASTRLHHLVDLGNSIGLFVPGTKLKGRRPLKKIEDPLTNDAFKPRINRKCCRTKRRDCTKVII